MTHPKLLPQPLLSSLAHTVKGQLQFSLKPLCLFPQGLLDELLCGGDRWRQVYPRQLSLTSAFHLSLLPLSLSSFLRSRHSPLPLSLQLLHMRPLQAAAGPMRAMGMHLTTLHQEARLWCTFNSASSPAVLLRSSSRASAMALRLTSLSA